MRLIDADALEEHKFVGNKFVQNDYQQGWNDAIDAIIDNAPTVEDRYDEGYAQGFVDGSTGADWIGDDE